MREYDFDACADHEHNWQVIGRNIFGADISECSICGLRRAGDTRAVFTSKEGLFDVVKEEDDDQT